MSYNVIRCDFDLRPNRQQHIYLLDAQAIFDADFDDTRRPGYSTSNKPRT